MNSSGNNAPTRNIYGDSDMLSTRGGYFLVASGSSSCADVQGISEVNMESVARHTEWQRHHTRGHNDMSRFSAFLDFIFR